MKHIIFDMDGTLVNSGKMIAGTINFVRDNIGLGPLPLIQMLEKINDPHINPSEYFYGTKEYTQQQMDLFTQHYHKNCIIGVELYEGIYDMLEIVSKNYQLSIATNASSVFANKILQHLGVDHFFDHIVGADMVEQSKPHPQMILDIITQFDLHKDNCILVGDSHKDLYAANNAGIKSLIVNWGFTQYNEQEVINSVKELQKRLNEH